MLRHRAAQDHCVHGRDELRGVNARGNDGVEVHRDARQAARGERDGGVHPVEQRTAIHPVCLAFGIPVWGHVLVERLAEVDHHLRQSQRGIGVGAHRTQRAHDEFQRRLHLGAHVGRRPEVGTVEDGAQDLADVAAGAPPRRHGVIHAAIGRVVADEPLAQLLADVMHRRRMVGEPLEQTDAFVPSVAGRVHEAHDNLLSAVVGPLVERERCPLAGALDAPSREDPRHVDDVLLGIATVHAERVQLEQLAGVVLVDPLGHALVG